MKRTLTFVWVAGFLVGIGVLAGHLVVRAANLTRPVIDITTPEKKSAGRPTHVHFEHMRHVSEFGATCEMCHPAIADELNSPRNSQKEVHDACRQCHAKNKPGKSFLCAKCHIP
ncbi:hypothetical protein JXA80_04545 [bacterium]|nr:hypothetical protein [candidate division CSSED10-310 bacterium]